MKNKNFVFNITITELIILLFFIISLLSTTKINDKNERLENIQKELEQKNEKIAQLNEKVNEQKNFILKLINNPKMIDYFDELMNMQKYIEQITKISLENERLKKIINDLNNEQKKFDELEKLSKDINEQINSKKEIISALKKINTMNDIDELKKLVENKENINKEIRNLKHELENKNSELDESKKLLENLEQKNIELSENNFNFKGQVSYLNKKLNQKEGGNGLPPCWVDESGKIEYLFFVEMFEDKLHVILHSKAKLEKANKILNLQKIVDKDLSLKNFMYLTNPLFNKSVEDECRHYVIIKDSTVSKNEFKKKMLTIENHFYKYILRN